MKDQRQTLNSCSNLTLTIGGLLVGVVDERASDLDLNSLWAPFHSQSKSSIDIKITVQWAGSLTDKAMPWNFDSGAVWRVYEAGTDFVFDFKSSLLGNLPYKRLIVDKQFRNALLQMNAACFSDGVYDANPLEYPLDELLIMHRLTQEKAIELHGTGIVRANGDANLFVGHSGAGKSTTTRLWTSVEDVEVLSDDRIIVRRDEGAVAETPRCAGDSASTRGVLRLPENCASPSSHSAQDDNALGASVISRYKMRMYGTPWHGEAMFASPNSAPLSRIFVLEHGHGNVITPLTPSQAVAELFARSFVPFHRHEYVDSALVFLEELANSVPVYRYSFEPDQRAVEKIQRFRD